MLYRYKICIKNILYTYIYMYIVIFYLFLRRPTRWAGERVREKVSFWHCRFGAGTSLLLWVLQLGGVSLWRGQPLGSGLLASTAVFLVSSEGDVRHREPCPAEPTKPSAGSKNIVKCTVVILFAYRNYILQPGENCVNTSVLLGTGTKTLSIP